MRIQYGLLKHGIKVDGHPVPSYEIGGHEIAVSNDEATKPAHALSHFLGNCVVDDLAFRFFPTLTEQLEALAAEGLEVDYEAVEQAVRYCALWASFAGYEKMVGYDPADNLGSLVRFTEMLMRHRYTEYHVHGRITPTKKLGRGQFPCCIEAIYLDAEIRRAERLRKLALEVTTRIERRR